MANEFKHATVGTELTQSEFELVTLHVLDAQVRGDIIISNTAATGLIRLAKGAAGEHLVMDANDPTWESIPPRNALIWASAMVSPGTAGAAPGVVDGTNVVYQTKDFDQTTEEHTDFSIEIPAEYTGGNILWRAIWTAAAGAGTVAWEVNTLNVANDEVIDAALTDRGSMVDTLLALGDRHLSPTLTQSTGLPSASETMLVRISRDVAADTLTGDARLIAILIQIPVRGS